MSNFALMIFYFSLRVF